MHGIIAAQITGCGFQHQVQSMELAERDMLARLDCVTLSRLHAILLITHDHMETGKLRKAFMLIAIAARFATVMRLNHEVPGLHTTQSEVRRRIAWLLKFKERYFSIVLLEFEVCPFEAIYLELSAHPSSSGDVEERPNDHGAYRLATKLEVIRRDIMKFSRCTSLGDGGSALFLKLFSSSAEELGWIAVQIHPDLGDSFAYEHIHDTWLPRRIFLQLSMHQCHHDLWRLLLPGYREAAPSELLQDLDPDTNATAEQQCWDHAILIIRVVTSLNEQSLNAFLLEFDTAICVYHAIRLALFVASSRLAWIMAAMSSQLAVRIYPLRR